MREAWHVRDRLQPLNDPRREDLERVAGGKHEALDPVPVAAEIVLALQCEVARRTPVTDPMVLSISKIAGGSTQNVLPDTVELLGTLRTLSPEGRERGRAAFDRICTHVAAAHGCQAEVAIDAGYPPTINDPRAVALIRKLAGKAFLELPASSMGGAYGDT